MTIREFFSTASKETSFRVSIHDKKYHYICATPGESVLYIDFDTHDEYLGAFDRAADFTIDEWWVQFNTGTIHIMINELIGDRHD